MNYEEAPKYEINSNNDPFELMDRIVEVKDGLEDKIKEDYLKTFRKQVDFHHKVAYRFEKVYRLGKKTSVKK